MLKLSTTKVWWIRRGTYYYTKMDMTSAYFGNVTKKTLETIAIVLETKYISDLKMAEKFKAVVKIYDCFLYTIKM